MHGTDSRRFWQSHMQNDSDIQQSATFISEGNRLMHSSQWLRIPITMYFLVAILLISACKQSKAGSYIVTYTGGITTYTSMYGGGTVPFSTSNGTYSGNMSSSSSCNSAGTITVSFQWQPNAGMDFVTDPAPNSVIIKLSASASAIDYGSMFGGTPSTIVADDGLGDPQTVGQYTVSSSGDAYTSCSSSSPLVNFTSSLLPAPNVLSKWNGTGWPMTQVYYSLTASAYPVTIALTGGLKVNGEITYLIGQQCSASISLPALSADGATYSWSAQGGAPFGNFTTASTIYDNSQFAKSVFQPDPVLTNPSLICYFSQGPAPITISCCAVFKFGTYVVTCTPVTTAATQIPSFKRLFLNIGATSISGGQLGLFGAAFPMGYPMGPGAGIYWYGQVATPAPFNNNPSTWGVAQMFKTTRSYTQLGVPYDMFWLPLMSNPVNIVADQVPGLDTMFPYDDPTGWFPADGSNQGDGDRPNVRLNGVKTFTGGDSFSDVIMYFPPGQGSVPVPIATFTWLWSGVAAYSTDANGNSVWSLQNPNQANSPVITPAFGAWPAWTRRYSLSTMANLQYMQR